MTKFLFTQAGYIINLSTDNAVRGVDNQPIVFASYQDAVVFVEQEYGGDITDIEVDDGKEN